MLLESGGNERCQVAGDRGLKGIDGICEPEAVVGAPFNMVETILAGDETCKMYTVFSEVLDQVAVIASACLTPP